MRSGTAQLQVVVHRHHCLPNSEDQTRGQQNEMHQYRRNYHVKHVSLSVFKGVEITSQP